MADCPRCRVWIGFPGERNPRGTRLEINSIKIAPQFLRLYVRAYRSFYLEYYFHPLNRETLEIKKYSFHRILRSIGCSELYRIG